jgi:multimeric flavodoxin WrbA
MKKILVISGSSRKNGNSMKLVSMFTSQLEQNQYDIEFLNLTDYKLAFCRGCSACFKNNESFCPLKDDVSIIAEKMKAADGLIFVSPIYGRLISGQMKTLIDRISYIYHRPAMIAKPAVFLTTADVGYIKEVSRYMQFMITTMGMRSVGTAGALSGGLKNSESYRVDILHKLNKLTIEFEKELSRTSLPKPNFQELLHFTKWKIKNKVFKEIYAYDYSYWKEKGWLDSQYYYETEISVWNRFILNIITKVLPSIVVKKSMLNL